MPFGTVPFFHLDGTAPSLHLIPAFSAASGSIFLSASASAFVAPTAVLIGDVEVGEEASIWFGAVLRGDNGPIRVGARANIQDNSVLHVSQGGATVIEDDVTVGHCAILEDCTIAKGSAAPSSGGPPVRIVTSRPLRCIARARAAARRQWPMPSRC